MVIVDLEIDDSNIFLTMTSVLVVVVAEVDTVVV
jgi:hypothetical protein